MGNSENQIAAYGPFQGERVFDPRTMSYIHEEFVGPNISTGFIGALGWAKSGTISILAGEANHTGIRGISTGVTINTMAVIALHGSVGELLPADMFDINFVFRLNSNDSNTTSRVGLNTLSTGNPGTDGIYFEKLNTDTNWFAVTRASSTQTRTDMGIAAAASFSRFNICRKNSSTIGFRIDDGTEVIHTTNIPTADMGAVVQVYNHIASAKDADVDFFDCLIKEMSR